MKPAAAECLFSWIRYQAALSGLGVLLDDLSGTREVPGVTDAINSLYPELLAEYLETARRMEERSVEHGYISVARFHLVDPSLEGDESFHTRYLVRNLGSATNQIESLVTPTSD